MGRGAGRQAPVLRTVAGRNPLQRRQAAAAERENVCSEGSEAQESDRSVGTSGSRDELQRERP